MNRPLCLLLIITLASCSKSRDADPPVPAPVPLAAAAGYAGMYACHESDNTSSLSSNGNIFIGGEKDLLVEVAEGLTGWRSVRLLGGEFGLDSTGFFTGGFSYGTGAYKREITFRNDSLYVVDEYYSRMKMGTVRLTGIRKL